MAGILRRPDASSTSATERSVTEALPWVRWTRSRYVPYAHVAVLVVVSAMSLVLRRRVPVVLNNSGYDGLLFARNAESITAGDWLGSFTNLTLSKGPGYPLFMAAAHSIGLELKVAEQAVYLAAAGAVALSVLVCTRRRWLGTTAFVVLALDPSNFGASSADIVRDNVFSSLGLLALAAAFLTAWAVAGKKPLVLIAIGAAVFGISASSYWLTREEGITLAPPVALVVLGLVLLAWWTRHRAARRDGVRPGLLRRSAPSVVALLVAGIAMAGPLAAVRYENGSRYGVQLDNDMAQGTFMRAYADWSRVQAGERQYRTPITEAQRRAVYPVSEAARELEPFLEDQANGWRYFGCTTDVCDYGGGWMVWALRDAANSAGQFRDAQTAQAFFATLSDEISTACDDGTLTCAPALPASLQPLQRAPLGDLLQHYGSLAVDLVTAQGMYEGPGGAAVIAPEMRAEYAAIIDGVPVDDAAAADQTAQFVPRIQQYEALANVYRLLVPLLLVTAAVGLVVGAVRALRRRDEASALLVLGTALLAGVLIRLFLLALVDTAEYDVALARYQLPGYFLLVAFGIVGSAAAFQTPSAAPSTGLDDAIQQDVEAPGGDHADDTVVVRRAPLVDVPAVSHRG